MNTTDSPTFVDLTSTNITNSGNITSKNIIKGAIRSHPTGLTSGDIYAGYNNPVGIQGILLDNSSDITKRAGIVQRAYNNRTTYTTERAGGTAASPTGLSQGNQLLELQSTGYVGGSNSGWISDKVANVPGIVRMVASENWDDGLNKTGTRFQVILQPPSTTLTTSSNLVALNIATDSSFYNSDNHIFADKTGNQAMTIDSNDIIFRKNQTQFQATDGSQVFNVQGKSISGRNTVSLIDTEAGGATGSANFPSLNFTTSRSTVSGNVRTYIATKQGDVLGEYKFNGNALTNTDYPQVPYGPGGNIICNATEDWSMTANGTAWAFLAVKNGTTDSYAVINASPGSTSLVSDQFIFATAESTPVNLIEINSTRAKFNRPVELPSYTATAANAITGAVGQMIAITNSSGGSNPNGMIAFWDTSNSRWSYIHDNSAV